MIQVNDNDYFNIHQWLRKNYTKAGQCKWCGQVRKTAFALLKGKPYEYKRDNFVEICYPCHGKYDSPINMSEIMRKVMLNNPKQSRRVAQLDLEGNVIKVYPSLSEASRALGAGTALTGTITHACRGETLMARGFRWCYVDDKLERKL